MNTADIQKLVDIMDELREKCPWDKKQTIHTLRQQTIEELYEFIDAVDAEDWQHMKEELGDLLLHIVFYSKIGNENNEFSLQDVINGISEKLIRRHPHVYGDVKLNDAEEVKKNWEKIKLSEGRESLMEGVPASLPAIVKALRIQKKAAHVGFEWKKSENVWKKVLEEKNELDEAFQNGDRSSCEAEAGDLLFSVVNYIRFLGIDAAYALQLTNKKFISRFQKMEELAQREFHKKIHNLNLEEMDELWNRIKKNPSNC